MNEQDPAEETLKGAMRIATTAAMQIGAVTQRHLQQLLEKRSAQTEQETREALARFNSDKALAENYLAPVRTTQWWDNASPEHVSTALSTAYGWKEHSEVADKTFEHMKQELKDRYGIDVEANAPELAQVESQLENFKQQREQAEAERQQAAANDEFAQARLTLAEADRLDARAASVEAQANVELDPELREQLHAEAGSLRTASAHAQNESARSYDSAAGRESRANALQQQGIDPRLAELRGRADIAQAKPAQDALKHSPNTAKPKGKSGAGANRQAQLTR